MKRCTTGDTLEDYHSLWRQYDLNHDRCLEFKVFCLTTWKLFSFQRVFLLRTRNFLNDDKSDMMIRANMWWEVDRRRFKQKYFVIFSKLYDNRFIKIYHKFLHPISISTAYLKLDESIDDSLSTLINFWINLLSLTNKKFR